MATPFREVLEFFNNIGLFDVVLPFILVFTIVFALLDRTRVFGVEEIEGKKYPKKNLNSAAAFVISFLVVASTKLVGIITEISSNFVVLLVLIVLFLLLVGSFFQEKPEGVFLEGGWKTTFMVIVFIVMVFIALDALELMDDTFGFLSGSDKGEIVGSVVLLVLIVLFIAFITQDNKHKSDKKT
tara:strand:- start:500 stop:1051 length:552 start_codon:yes stop_codon:yes gene_type:complete